jgi:hypothetical protein
MKTQEELEEIFFLMYHLGWSADSARSMKSWERKWIIERFIKEKRGKDVK